MHMLSDYVKRSQLLLFSLLCLVIAWAIWIPQAVTKLSNPQTSFAGGSPLNLLAVWAPALSAILLSRVKQGKAGLQALFHPIRRWRVGIQWYLFILLYPAAIWFLARAIDAVLGRAFEFTIPILTFFPPEQAHMVAVALVFAFPNTLGEELGWRGFALPRLQTKYNALVSSIMLGLFWAVWHIPMWIANDVMGLDLLISVVTITTYAIIFTWVYNNTGGSVLLAWLFHASMTITQYFLQIPLTLTDDILRWGVAILVVIIAGSTHLSRKQERCKLLTEPRAG
jgi:membrane protease YdiL (CAAX protease family)